MPLPPKVMKRGIQGSWLVEQIAEKDHHAARADSCGQFVKQRGDFRLFLRSGVFDRRCQAGKMRGHGTGSNFAADLTFERDETDGVLLAQDQVREARRQDLRVAEFAYRVV